MNESAKINASFAKSFLSISIAIAVIIGGLFIYKSVTGYQKVTFVDHYDNCSVSVNMETRRSYSRKHRRTKRYYYVRVVNAEHNIDLNYSCSRSYYKGFQKYNGRRDVKLSFFAKENGEIFPVYRLGCDEKEAERELRGIDRPIGWYILYRAGLVIAAAAFFIGLKANRTARNYTNAPAIKTPTKEQQDMVDEIDRLLAQDKYGKYKNHKLK